MLRVTQEQGIRDEAVMRVGYLLVDMTLARLHADILAWSSIAIGGAMCCGSDSCAC